MTGDDCPHLRPADGGRYQVCALWPDGDDLRDCPLHPQGDDDWGPYDVEDGRRLRAECPLCSIAAALDEAREREVPETLFDILSAAPLTVPQQGEIWRLMQAGLISEKLFVRILGKPTAEAAKGETP